MAQEASNIPQNIYPIRVQVVGASGEQVTDFGSGGGGGGAVTVADGADTTQGALADAAVTAGSAGSLSGKLRQISSDIVSGSQQTKITDGTDVVDVTTGDSGQNGLVTAGSRKETSFTTTTAQAVGTTDVSNYRWVSVHVVTQGGSSTVNFQVSNDNTNWVSASLMISSAIGATLPTVSTTSASVVYAGALNARYFRLNVTGIASGTTAGVIEFFSQAPAQISNLTSVNQTGTWTVGSNSATGATVPANAFYMGLNDLTTGFLVGARAASSSTNTSSGILASGIVAVLDDTSPTAITENSFGSVRMSSDRSLFTTPRSTTPTQTSVASSASSVSLLAANNARKGATITNDSTAILYLKLGATASTTSYTVTLNGAVAAPFVYYEVPYGYVGAIDGIWASANGNARITELA